MKINSNTINYMINQRQRNWNMQKIGISFEHFYSKKHKGLAQFSI